MKKIFPARLRGRLKIQPSKSVAHRLLVCAALARGTSVIENVVLSRDVKATMEALRDMGLCTYEMKDGTCTVQGGLHEGRKNAVVDCGESGSTLRFLIPLAFDGVQRRFIGQGRLMSRPMGPYDELFRGKGYHRKKEAIEICGKLNAGTFALPGDISSQFITGLLFALPLAGDDSVIELTSPPQSRHYIDLTMGVLAESNIISDWRGDSIFVRGNQVYTPCRTRVEGDFSHAAFFAVAAALQRVGSITITGLKQDSLQGDRAIFNLLHAMGAEVIWDSDAVTVRPGPLKPVDIDVSQIPDLFPVLAVLACGIDGTTTIRGAQRLRYKESNRLEAMAHELEALGAELAEYDDSLVIHGTGKLRGGEVHTHGDHRIAMALAVASVIADGAVILDEPDVVEKSAPAFFDEWTLLGGETS